MTDGVPPLGLISMPWAAAETALHMNASPSVQPEMKFHKDSGLLIVRGEPEDVSTLREVIERAHRLGFARVVVFPYLLFTGRLVEQVRATVAAYQNRHPDVQAVVAPYLNAHPLVVETFLERLAEAECGMAQMNCQFCSYRTPIVGREDWQGAPQTGHHHDHDHDDHEHGHHHYIQSSLPVLLPEDQGKK